MKRSRFLIATAAGVAALGASSVPAPDFADAEALRNFGAVDERARLAKMAEALPPEALAGGFTYRRPRPSAARQVLDPLPPVSYQGVTGDRGSPGSCSAQSYGYAMGTYTSALGTSRDLSLASNQASAAWLYKKIHSVMSPPKACPNGSTGVDYLDHLVRSGAPSGRDFPYDPNPAEYDDPANLCRYLDTADLTAHYGDESLFTLGGYKVFPHITGKMSTYLEIFKSFLDAGHMIAFGGQNHTTNSYEGMPKLSPQGVYIPPKLTVPPTPTHAQVVVGYDDGLGAFLVQNSFGAKWNEAGPMPGANGRIWFSYERFFEYQLAAAVAYPNVPPPAYGTRLVCRPANGPIVTIHSTGTFADVRRSKNILRFDLSAPASIFVTHLHVTGPKGGAYEQDVNETIRAGYVYVQKPIDVPFLHGPYRVRLTASEGSEAFEYSGVAEYRS